MTTRNDRRTRLIHKILSGQALFGLIIASLAIFLLMYAAGYRFDFKNFVFKKTGVIYVNVLPTNAKFYINDKLIDKSYPFAKNFAPGLYEIDIKLDDFQTWHQAIRLKADGVYSYEKIQLFRERPPVMPLEDQNKIELISAPSGEFADIAPKKLTYNLNEIWIDNNLVSRFSDTISNVKWFSDLNHIIFQQGKQIRVIDIDGTNDKLLVEMKNDNNSRFVLGKNGFELYFLDGSEYRIAYIL